MKATFFALTPLLWAGSAVANPCRATQPLTTTTPAAAVSSPAAPTSSPAAPPASSSAPASPPALVSTSSPAPAVVSSSPAPATSSSSTAAIVSSVPAVIFPPPASTSTVAPSTFSSAAPSTFVSVVIPSTTTSSPAVPSQTGVTSNPGAPTCNPDNVFVNPDFSLGLTSWPSDILTGSPLCTLGDNCGTSTSGAAYASCLELDLVTLGKAEGLDFHQKVKVVKETSYMGSFYYRLPSLGASGQSMATLTCTMDGVTKFSTVLCDDDASETWKKVTFAYTADCAEAEFMCKVTTTAVTAKIQFADFFLGAQC
ncbi:MAG: hypothetical protein STHCBS139747_000561 [Sporothrix thermara]